jgi:hypothetical protein
MSRPTFLEKEKLKTDGSNFTTWFRTLRIILTPHKMGYVLDVAMGVAPKEGASNNEKAVYQTKVPPKWHGLCHGVRSAKAL